MPAVEVWRPNRSRRISGHVLFAGITQSGKTSLAKRLSCSYQLSSLVLDPLNDPGWRAAYQTTDPREFLLACRHSYDCALFIDESGSMIGRYDEPMQWLATQARHWGHLSHFITQRPSQLARNVRDQCTRLFLFACSFEDAKTLAREWNKPDLLQAAALRQGEFLACSRFAPVTRGKIF